MISDRDIKSITTKLLEDRFYNYFKKPKAKTSHIILDRLFPEERRISSAMAGLQTSLGSFWETLSVELAKKNKFEILKPSSVQRPKTNLTALQSIINETKSHREDLGGSLKDFKKKLNDSFKLNKKPKGFFQPMLSGKGVDLVFKKKVAFIFLMSKQSR